MDKTIMILGANTLQTPLIGKANELGYKTLVISPNRNEPGHKIATYSEFIDISNEKEILEIARKYKIEGVITDQTDIPVRTVAYVAKELGLPGNAYDTACLFTNKFMMREKCKELGIRTLDYRLCNNLSDCIDFFEKINKDVIIKPIDNQGSKGVYRVSSLNELSLRYNEALKYSRTKKILIEEFVEGREFVVEGICCNYEFKNLICGDTYYFDIPDVFSATKREFPSIADKELRDKVLHINKKIIEGFGLKQGITHSEYIINKNDIILIETAARGGGVFISSDIINLQTGLETEEFLIDIATNNNATMPKFTEKKASTCYLSFFLPEGVIETIEGVDYVINLPYTYHNNLLDIKIGEKTKSIKDKTGRFFIIINGNNHADLNDKINDIKSHLYIDVITKEGIEGIIWE